MTSKSSFSKEITSATAFVGDSRLRHILVMCRLEPVDGWRAWSDDVGNLLRLHSNGRLAVYPSSRPTLSRRDLYVKGRPEIVEERSVWALILRGKGGRDMALPIGRDGQLRLCWFTDGIWASNEKPLLVGIPLLRFTIDRYMSDTEEEELKPPAVSPRFSFEAIEAFTTKKPWLKNLTRSHSKAK
jgi:hypothetical protein